jgi:hypothetical protein
VATVRIKRSNTAAATPASLADGEIAVNQSDGTLFYHTAAGGVAQLPKGDLTQTTADARYVNVTGDTMTGGLAINAATPLTVTGGRTYLAAASEPYGAGVRYVSSGGAVYFGATDATATPGAQISGAGGSPLMSFTNAGAASIPGTLTVGGTAVVVSSDSRLTDARTPLSHTHAASTITGLATVATSGSYNDLTNLPAAPTFGRFLALC